MQRKNKFFDLKDLAETPEPAREGVFSAYLNHHLEKVSRVDDLVRMPNEGEIFFIYTENAFNAFTFLPWLAKRFFLQEVFASTYSISRRVVEALQEMHQAGKIGEVTLLISDSMPKRNPATIENLEAICRSNKNIRAKYFWNHSKVTLAKIKLEDFTAHLVLTGSGNWSENAQLEQYTLTNSEEVYNFFKEMFEK